jgi:hypothetical protein
MGRQYHRWTPEETQFLRDNVAGRSLAEITKMFNKRFGCSVSVKKVESILARNRLRSGRDTKFKPNNRGGSSEHLWSRRPVGSENMEGGYVLVKVSDPDVWVKKHRLVWETAHGPIPEGYRVIFADGDRSNFAIDNLLLVSHAEQGFMNHIGLRFSDRDLTRAGHALAALSLEIAERERELGLRRPKRPYKKKKQGADRHDNGTETEAANRRGAGNNPAGKEEAV